MKCSHMYSIFQPLHILISTYIIHTIAMVTNNWIVNNIQDLPAFGLTKTRRGVFIIAQFKSTYEGSSWSWSYGSWIYHYLCNQCLSRGVASEFILVRRNGRLARGVWHAPPRNFLKKGAILCYLGAFPRLYFRLFEGHNITIFFFDLNVTLWVVQNQIVFTF